MRSLLIFLLLPLTAAATHAQQTTWTGASSSVWNSLANWDAGIPDDTTDAIIPPGTPNAPSTAGASAPECDTLTVQAGATLTIAAGSPLAVHGGGTLDGTIIGNDVIDFVDHGTVAGASPWPDVVISGGTQTVNSATFGGTVSMTGGTFYVNANATVVFQGTATFSGGTISHGNSGSLMDFDADVTFSGTAANNVPHINCSASWTADAGFDPTSGRTFTFDAAGTQAVDGARYDALVIAAGSTVVPAQPLVVDLTCTIDGVLDLAGHTHQLKQHLNLNGGFTGTGAFEFIGNAGQTLNSAVPLPNCIVNKSGSSLTLNGSLVFPNGFSHTAGTLYVNANSTATFTAPSTFSGGVLSHGNAGSLMDFDADVTFSGTVAQNVPHIACSANWTADAGFDPTSGRTFTFDGAGTQAVDGAHYDSLVIAAGSTVVPAQALVVDHTCTIDGVLDLAGHTHQFKQHLNLNGGFTGTGTFEFIGNAGQTLNSAVPLPNCIVNKSGSSLTLNGSLVFPNGFSHTAGTLYVNSNSTATFTAPSTFSGGVLSHGNSGSLMDFDADVTFSGTVANNVPPITCSANWTADANFDPTSGRTFTFDAAGTQTVDGANFDYVVIAAGATVVPVQAFVFDFTCTIDGVLDLAGHTHQFKQHLNLNGSFTGTGTFEFVGGAGQTLNSSVSLPNCIVNKSASSLTLTGSLTFPAGFSLMAGTLYVNSNSTATFTAPSTFSGGVLSHGNAGSLMDFDADVTFSGTVANNVPAITCSANWTADANFDPNSGRTVTFDGTSPQTVDGANFDYVVIAAGATVVPVQAFVFDFTCTIDGVLDLAGHTHQFKQHLNLNGSFTGTGAFEFVGGSGQTLNSSVSLPNCIVNKSASTLTLNGSLTFPAGFSLIAGTLFVNSNSTATFTAPSTFSGGVLSHGNAGSVMDFDADVTFSGTVANNVPAITCSANWTADANFDPNSNRTVTFDGTSPQTVDGANFDYVVIAAGATVVSVQPFVFDKACTIDGALDPAGLTHQFKSHLTFNGSVTGTGTFEFIGGAGQTLDGSGSLPDCIVNKSGSSLTLQSVTFGGTFTHSAGTVFMNSNHTAVFQGPATFNGGTISHGNSASTFDFDADVTFAGTTAQNVPQIRAAGNWIADANFDPNSGRTVELDGAAPTTLIPPTPGGVLHFGNLVVKNGVRTPTADVTLDATSITVDATGELDILTHRVAIPQGTLTVDGKLACGAGGKIALGPITANVGSTGTLELHGQAGNTATVEGEGAGGYGLTIAGTISAQHFGFRAMNAAGVVITSGATIAAAPHDLTNGSFDAPAVGGGPLLDIQRANPATIDAIAFDNSNGLAQHNVRTLGGAAVTFTNWSGGYGGVFHEDDPGSLVSWGPTNTVLVSFTTIPGPERVFVDFTTTLEQNVVTFDLQRSTSATGPFATVASFAAVGPTSYSYKDPGLTDGVTYHYRLVEMIAAGPSAILATGQATVYSGALPPNVLTVGPNGLYPTIQAAINAATMSNSVVRIEPGTYDSFTIDDTAPTGVKVVGDGTGLVTIDTTTGPVMLVNNSFQTNVELKGIEIGSPSSPNPGLVVSNCDATVLLDDLGIHGGTGQPGLEVIASPYVVCQDNDVTGTPGVRVDGASEVYASRGTVDSVELQAGAEGTICDLVPGSQLVDPAATLTTVPGVMPRLLWPDTIALGCDYSVAMHADPIHAWVLGICFCLNWTEFSNPLVDMICLMDVPSAIAFDFGTTDQTGLDTRTYPMGTAQTLLGQTFTAQILVYDPVGVRWHFSSAATSIVVP